MKTRSSVARAFCKRCESVWSSSTIRIFFTACAVRTVDINRYVSRKMPVRLSRQSATYCPRCRRFPQSLVSTFPIQIQVGQATRTREGMAHTLLILLVVRASLLEMQSPKGPISRMGPFFIFPFLKSWRAFRCGNFQAWFWRPGRDTDNAR